jgi:hypothetical protein
MTSISRWCVLCGIVAATLQVTSAFADEKKSEAQSSQEAKTPKSAKKAEKSIDEIKKEWAKKLSGADLIGFYTTDGQNPKDQRKDRYRMSTVSVAQDDRWIFTYLHNNIPIPLALKVKMAGDTPVIIMDEFKIAGMGTFSARVMFHGDRYAGTWQHGKVGGLMFGRLDTAAARKAKRDRAASPTKK